MILGKKCPAHTEDSWPASEICTIVPVGALCLSMHTTTLELRFAHSVYSHRKILRIAINRIDMRSKQTPISEAFNLRIGRQSNWNLTGNILNACIVCGQKVHKKGVSKGICSYCGMHKTNDCKLKIYRLHSRAKLKANDRRLK